MLTDISLLQAFFDDNIEDRYVHIVKEEPEEFSKGKNRENSPLVDVKSGLKLRSSNKPIAASSQSARLTSLKARNDLASLKKIREQEEGSSSERPKKLVRF